MFIVIPARQGHAPPEFFCAESLFALKVAGVISAE